MGIDEVFNSVKRENFGAYLKSLIFVINHFLLRYCSTLQPKRRPIIERAGLTIVTEWAFCKTISIQNSK